MNILYRMRVKCCKRNFVKKTSSKISWKSSGTLSLHSRIGLDKSRPQWKLEIPGFDKESCQSTVGDGLQLNWLWEKCSQIKINLISEKMGGKIFCNFYNVGYGKWKDIYLKQHARMRNILTEKIGQTETESEYNWKYIKYFGFSQNINMHWLVPYFCNRIWKYTRKVWKITVFKRNADKILINLCLVVNFRCCVQVLTFWNVSKCPEIYFFGQFFCVL